MSWDECGSKSHPCPCGNGHYTISYLMDDWNRSDERWEMQCETCRASYTLFSFWTYRHGLSEERHGWAANSLIEALRQARNHQQEKERGVIIYLETNIKDAWLAHFFGKSKKLVWEQLTESGKTYPSLGTFYTHTRQDSMEAVLLGYLKPDSVETVTRVLGAKDEQLTALVREMKSARDDADNQEIFVKRHLFR